MPRNPRLISPTGFYHIMLRGINKQIVFEDRYDYEKFLRILSECKTAFSFELDAYCLMDNHIHLLIGVDNNALSELMKKIAQSYSSYFNCRYCRNGHLFQNRFKSEPIINDVQFLTVLRYIIQNPEKAGISSASNYCWSSYNEYSTNSLLVDTQKAIEIAGSRSELIRFLSQENPDVCMDIPSFRSFSDTDAIRLIKDECHISSPIELQKFNRADRNCHLAHLKNCGLSTRQLERLTGISRSVVQRA